MTGAQKISRSTTAGIVLVGLAALILFQRIYTFDEPLERNIGIYSVTSHEMLAGRALYTDMWEHRPPGIFWIYAAGELLFGYNTLGILMLNLIGSCVILLGVYRAASCRGSPLRTGLWAAFFWAVLSGDLFFRANQPESELFINACTVWALALLLRLPAEKPALKRCLGIGALLALASAIRSVSFVSAVLLAGAHVLFAFRRRTPQGVWLRQAAAMAVPGFVMWALICGYYGAKGDFAVFYTANVSFNQFFAGGFWGNLWRSLHFSHLIPAVFRSLTPFWIAALAGAVWGGARGSRAWGLLAALIAAAQIQLALQGRFEWSYYQIWMPVLVIGAAWFLEDLGRMTGRVPWPKAAVLLSVMLGGLLVLREQVFYRIPVEGWSYAKYGHRYYSEAKKLGLLLKDTLREEETFFQWGFEPTLYFYSRKSPPAGHLHIAALLLESPVQHEQTQRVLAALQRKPPALFVVSKWALSRPDSVRHPVTAWYRGEYQPVAGGDLGHFVLFVRRGSVLAERLRLQSGG
ncbi:MAG: hypothetical protein ABIJ96_08620 [Elusimicrobiota bacterium]